MLEFALSRENFEVVGVSRGTWRHHQIQLLRVIRFDATRKSLFRFGVLRQVRDEPIQSFPGKIHPTVFLGLG